MFTSFHHFHARRGLRHLAGCRCAAAGNRGFSSCRAETWVTILWVFLVPLGSLVSPLSIYAAVSSCRGFSGLTSFRWFLSCCGSTECFRACVPTRPPSWWRLSSELGAKDYAWERHGRGQGAGSLLHERICWGIRQGHCLRRRTVSASSENSSHNFAAAHIIKPITPGMTPAGSGEHGSAGPAVLLALLRLHLLVSRFFYILHAYPAPLLQ